MNPRIESDEPEPVLNNSERGQDVRKNHYCESRLHGGFNALVLVWSVCFAVMTAVARPATNAAQDEQ